MFSGKFDFLPEKYGLQTAFGDKSSNLEWKRAHMFGSYLWALHSGIMSSKIKNID